MKEGVYGSFASKLCATQIIAPSVHKVIPHDNPILNMYSSMSIFLCLLQLQGTTMH